MGGEFDRNSKDKVVRMEQMLLLSGESLGAALKNIYECWPTITLQNDIESNWDSGTWVNAYDLHMLLEDKYYWLNFNIAVYEGGVLGSKSHTYSYSARVTEPVCNGNQTSSVHHGHRSSWTKRNIHLQWWNAAKEPYAGLSVWKPDFGWKNFVCTSRTSIKQRSCFWSKWDDYGDPTCSKQNFWSGYWEKDDMLPAMQAANTYHSGSIAVADGVQHFSMSTSADIQDGSCCVHWFRGGPTAINDLGCKVTIGPHPYIYVMVSGMRP
jgi:hypothetical protein